MQYQLGAILVFLTTSFATVFVSAQTLPRPVTESAALAAVRETKLTRESLYGKQFRFSWKSERGSSHIGTATLRKDGIIAGIRSPNETFWLVDDEGRLIFKHRDGQVSTIFTRAEQREGRWIFSGPFQFDEGVLHRLEEITAEVTTTSNDDLINRVVCPYSKQRIVSLDPGETYRFALGNGQTKTVRLVSVQEYRDRVVNMIRRAHVRVEIDAQPLDLVCSPYVMPTEFAGVRIQADTTSGWSVMPKRVQFSLWDARDPIVDTRRFTFPICNYRLFSHGMQAFNEPVNLGIGDNDPTGLKYYHDYAVDVAGYEGREKIVSATEGDVVRFWPSRENVCSVTVRDAAGFLWGYVHLGSFASEITLGAHVTRGQELGILGKTGPSGNFSHLHFGSYLPVGDVENDPPKHNQNLNLYPWLVTAYLAERPCGLLAVARPGHVVLTGEKEVFDASNSLAFGGHRIVAWRWVFHDNQQVNQPRAEKTFDQPGTYVATLWVKDEQGAEDMDFCQVKVFSRPNPEKAMPHIFMTSTPTEDIRPGQAVRFRFWFQGTGGGPIKVDFDDGTQVTNYRPYTELVHRFETGGIHVVTTHAEAAGRPITQKMKVVVLSASEVSK